MVETVQSLFIPSQHFDGALPLPVNAPLEVDPVTFLYLGSIDVDSGVECFPENSVCLQGNILLSSHHHGLVLLVELSLHLVVHVPVPWGEGVE